MYRICRFLLLLSPVLLLLLGANSVRAAPAIKPPPAEPHAATHDAMLDADYVREAANRTFDFLDGAHYSKYVNEIVQEVLGHENGSRALADHLMSAMMSAQHPDKHADTPRKHDDKHEATRGIPLHSIMNEGMRTRLDEIKRREMARLAHVEQLADRHRREPQLDIAALQLPDDLHDALRQMLRQEGGREGGAHADHVDKQEAQRFTWQDVERLTRKLLDNLNQVDRDEDDVYKRVLMHDRLRRRRRLARKRRLNGSEGAFDSGSGGSPEDVSEGGSKASADSSEQIGRRINMNIPGSIDHFKEVWRSQLNLPDDEFSLKILFNIKDLNANHYWELDEIEALVQNEVMKVAKFRVSKMWGHVESNKAEDPTLLELFRDHETRKMRKFMLLHYDKDGDARISLSELEKNLMTVENANTSDYQNLIEQTDPFTKNEFEEFAKNHEHDDNLEP